MKNGLNMLIVIGKKRVMVFGISGCFCSSVHGHQTNNFSEVNVRIFKDIVLSRNKAYNAVAFIDFIYTSLEEYYLRCLRTFVNGRNDTARHIFKDLLKRAI